MTVMQFLMSIVFPQGFLQNILRNGKEKKKKEPAVSHTAKGKNE